MAQASRTARVPASALRALLAARPFPRAAWESLTGETLHLRIGNAPPLTGRREALDRLQDFLACTETFASGFCEAWSVREAIYVETEVGFRAADGSARRIPCALVARTTHGLLHDLRFHLDPSPIPGLR